MGIGMGYGEGNVGLGISMGGKCGYGDQCRGCRVRGMWIYGDWCRGHRDVDTGNLYGGYRIYWKCVYMIWGIGDARNTEYGGMWIWRSMWEKFVQGGYGIYRVWGGDSTAAWVR